MQAEVTQGEYALEARSLSKSFGDFQAVNKVNLRVRANSIHGLIGPNGAGKTTLFNLLTKMMTPTSGSIVLNGRDITRSTPYQVAQLGMVRSFQISAVFPEMSALDNVRIALQRRNGLEIQFWQSRAKLNTLNDKAMELLAGVGLGDVSAMLARELPYGRKRALELATTLALDPTIMLLDEPMAGMSHDSIQDITALIRKASANRTVIVVEHNLSVVSTLCDRVSVLQRGGILAEGTYEEISTVPEVRTAYMGGQQ